MNEEHARRPKGPSLWRLLLGLLLVWASLRTWITPNPNIPAYLQYSNETQRIAGVTTQIAIFLLGLGLIGICVRRMWLRRKQESPQTDPSVEENPPAN